MREKKRDEEICWWNLSMSAKVICEDGVLARRVEFSLNILCPLQLQMQMQMQMISLLLLPT